MNNAHGISSAQPSSNSNLAGSSVTRHG
jgi:hypothetical protein